MKLRDDCEERLFQLIGKPTYTILASEAGYESTSVEFGDTGGFYDVFFRHTISPERWRGRGAGMVIHEETLSWEASRHRHSGWCQANGQAGFLHSPTMSVPRFNRLFWGVVLHEAAHLVAENLFSTAEVEGLDEPAKVEIVERWRRTRAEESTTPQPVDHPWMSAGDHGPRFVRAAVHLTWRAIRDGYSEFDFGDVLPDRYYGLDTKLFRSSLSTECRRRSDESIEGILDSPQPLNYQRLWDVLRRQTAA